LAPSSNKIPSAPAPRSLVCPAGKERGDKPRCCCQGPEQHLQVTAEGSLRARVKPVQNRSDTSRKRHPGGGPGQAATSTIFAGKGSGAEGRKVDELESLYVDTVTDLPSFGTGKAGMPTRHRLPVVADEPGGDDLPLSGGTGDGAGAGVVLAGLAAGVAVRVVAEFAEDPGAEDGSQAGLGQVDLSVRVAAKIRLHLPLQGFDLLVQDGDHRDQGADGA